MKETVFISGLYSGPSPSAGLGVARSLRAAFPSVRLVGVDYWAGSSGLHHEVFDATWLKPPWDLIEEDLYAKEVQAELDQGALWIPTLDLEVAWLARTLATHPLLLAPDEKALAPSRKPRPSVAELLPSRSRRRWTSLPPTRRSTPSAAPIPGACGSRARTTKRWRWGTGASSSRCGHG